MDVHFKLFFLVRSHLIIKTAVSSELINFQINFIYFDKVTFITGLLLTCTHENEFFNDGARIVYFVKQLHSSTVFLLDSACFLL